MQDILGYEGRYAVTADGHVWSYPKPRSSCNGKWLKPSPNSNGYLAVNLYRDRRRKNWTVHRLVALAYIPNPYQKSQLNHKDGNKTNNHAENLEWCNNRENYLHADSLGFIKQYTARQIETRRENGRKTGAMNSMKHLRLFSMRQASHIRRLHSDGQSGRSIARTVGCSEATIRKIVNNVSYMVAV